MHVAEREERIICFQVLVDVSYAGVGILSLFLSLGRTRRSEQGGNIGGEKI